MTTDWTDVDEAYERSFSVLCNGTIDALRAVVGPQPRSVLDVGGGLGTLAAALRADGHVVHLVDAQPSMVERARAQHPGLTCAVAALPTLPVPDRAYQVVTANFVINHVAAPLASVHELARASAELVAVTTWPAESELNRLWDELIASVGISWPPGLKLDPQADFPRTQDGVHALLSQAGLRDVQVGIVDWVLQLDPEALWTGVRAGIARIGTTYLAQGDSGRSRLDQAWAERTSTGLAIELRALIGTGSVRPGGPTGDLDCPP